ncbi:hypothetical protein Purlil1_13403 [Purpureocillium lilacinum]|uniref:Uncharacterized protein n=1 Tax=Purpureocillium lilacinum TaxID=33203 RepID=A0ABR0BE75_PURLI|nr:hypothetical protein Purlil1_13403 [Purpureocillium lilacinum]
MRLREAIAAALWPSTFSLYPVLPTLKDVDHQPHHALQQSHRAPFHTMAATYHDHNTTALGREPLESQNYVGGGMFMMAFIQPAAAPNRFAYPDDHHVKGLNAGTLAKI